MLRPGEKEKKGRVAKIAIGEGGTGYAIQMAINENKPVYVYDQSRKTWFTRVNNRWEVFNGTPVLTPNFAGVGTREINQDGKAAIRAVYEKTASLPGPAEGPAPAIPPAAAPAPAAPAAPKPKAAPQPVQSTGDVKTRLKAAADLYMKDWLENNPTYLSLKEDMSDKVRVTMDNLAEARRLNEENDVILDKNDRIAELPDFWEDTVTYSIDESFDGEIEGFKTILKEVDNPKLDIDDRLALAKLMERYGLIDLVPAKFKNQSGTISPKIKYSLDVLEKDLSSGLYEKLEDYIYDIENITEFVLEIASQEMKNITPFEKEELLEYVRRTAGTQDKNQLSLFDEIDNIINDKDQGC
jgi:hypothetical protein